MDDSQVRASTAYLQSLKLQNAGGEWRVEKQRLHWQVLEDFSLACEQASIPKTLDFNSGNNFGVGYFEVNQSKGIRWNTAKAFLRPTCYGRSNFEMWTHAHVSKLELTRQGNGQLKCSGLEVLTSSGRIKVQCLREVLLCAGAVATPQLLQLSGIGDQEELSRLGIQPVLHSPAVGANLQDHLQLRSIFKVHHTQTLNTLSRSWWGKLQMGLEYLLRQSGPLSMAPSQLGVFTKSDPSLLWPDLQFHVQPLSLGAFGEPLHEFDAMTASVCNLNPSSRGHIRLQSTDPKTPPLISPNYLSTPEDRRKAAQAIRITRLLMQQPAMAKYSPLEFSPGAQHQSDAELEIMAGQIGTTIFHPVGTARMGAKGDLGTVLDSRMRVQDHQRSDWVQGLRVVDASAMPTITGGNTNSPTLMMAEKAAHWIAQDHLHLQVH
jgi:choline dehydrogenase